MHLLASIPTWVFMVGMAGSLVVAILALIGDIQVFFKQDEHTGCPSAPV